MHGLVEEVIPSALDRVVVGMNSAAAREPGKGLHVRRFFKVVRIVVAKEKLVLVVEMMVEPDGGLITMGGVRKDASIGL